MIIGEVIFWLHIVHKHNVLFTLDNHLPTHFVGKLLLYYSSSTQSTGAEVGVQFLVQIPRLNASEIGNQLSRCKDTIFALTVKAQLQQFSFRK